MSDPFAKQIKTIDSVADNAYAITPDDAADLPTASRGMYVGTGGDIKVDLPKSAAPVVFVGVPSGAILPVRVKRVYVDGTTASDMVALL